MKVLFSPIGGTDPISNYRDGAMLHICRIYRPDKVYLYLSKEMCEYHDKDNRYVKAINYLAEEIGCNFEIEVLRDDEMRDVQIFDAFIDLFERYIEEIREKDMPDELLVNVSSGTPAMKSSLQMISMLWSEIVAIQVSTPKKALNKEHEDKDSYDVDVQWECNEDREADFENRSIISNASRLLDRIRKESIIKHIEVYDYESARALADTLSRKSSEEFWDCLNIAVARNKLDLFYVNANKKKYKISNWFPITKDKDMEEYEYLLSMQTKLWRKQYVDFIRDITPIFYSLSRKVLFRYCHLEFKDIGNEGTSSWYLSMEKLKKLGVTPESYWHDKTNISSNNILSIMKQLCDNKAILELMDNIRKAEREVRNLAAHEIMGVTYQWILKKTSFTPEAIMDMLFKYAECAGLKISEHERLIYNEMNHNLIDML
ncbi:MAG: hypothetical protein IJM37_08140 [Lachnospiraceae bacterium]|nr:hypothetical protein [Lachnospiraceae bacterium]